MTKRVCRLCGQEFEGNINTLYCQPCRIVTCPVCGKEFKPGNTQFTRYVKRGHLTCGNRECALELHRRVMEGRRK